ncbi:hypothetical protein P5V15_011831 [Pogonomyrmex californicus]
MACTSKTAAGDRRNLRKVDLSKVEESQAKEAFDLFDPDGTGKISSNKLKLVFKALGYDLSLQEIRKLVAEFRPDFPNEISYEDFLKIMSVKTMNQGIKEEMLQAFRLFDDNNTGKISFEDLKRVATELGENVTDAVLQDMIDQVDDDGDGEISLEEFSKIYQYMSR